MGMDHKKRFEAQAPGADNRASVSKDWQGQGCTDTHRDSFSAATPIMLWAILLPCLERMINYKSGRRRGILKRTGILLRRGDSDYRCVS